HEPWQLAGIAWHHSAPEADIDVHPFARRLDLGAQGLARGRGRNAVERHVHERRHASSGRGPRGGRESFPLGPARLVDVNVRIHDPRHDDRVTEIEPRPSRFDLIRGAETLDFSLTEVHRSLAYTLGRHHSLAAEDEVGWEHALRTVCWPLLPLSTPMLG